MDTVNFLSVTATTTTIHSCGIIIHDTRHASPPPPLPIASAHTRRTAPHATQGRTFIRNLPCTWRPPLTWRRPAASRRAPLASVMLMPKSKSRPRHRRRRPPQRCAAAALARWFEPLKRPPPRPPSLPSPRRTLSTISARDASPSPPGGEHTRYTTERERGGERARHAARLHFFVIFA